MEIATNKTNRIGARITPQHKSLFQEAAQLEGVSLTDFIVSTLYNRATNILLRHKQIVELDAEQSTRFVKALLKPREIEDVPVLQQAVRSYQER